MSKDNKTAATVEVDNKTTETETAEQRAERQARESAILRVAANTAAAMVLPDIGKNWDLPASKARSILSGLVTDSMKASTVKGKDQTASVKLAYLLDIDDDEIAAIAAVITRVRDSFRILYNSEATVQGGVQAKTFCQSAAGTFLPDSSAASADAYRKTALKAMIDMGIVKE